MTCSVTVEDSPIPGRRLVRVPVEISMQFPSRGMVMVEVTAAGEAFWVAFEPDGEGSHWGLLPRGVYPETTDWQLDIPKVWAEPAVPEDILAMLDAHPDALATWQSITPAARWDWIRWVGATKNLETRKKRLDSIPSRMRAGKRRPCCFDRAQCTLTDA